MQITKIYKLHMTSTSTKIWKYTDIYGTYFLNNLPISGIHTDYIQTSNMIKGSNFFDSIA